jgi:Ankyrin repeats (3 copies)
MVLSNGSAFTTSPKGMCVFMFDETEKTEATEDDTSLGGSVSEYTEDIDLDDDLDDIQLEMLEYERKLRRKSAAKSRRSSAPSLSAAVHALQEPSQPTQRASMPLISMASLQERIERASIHNGYFQAPQDTDTSSPKVNTKRPEDYLTQVILDNVPISFLQDDEFFEPVTPQRIAAHSLIVSSAIRAGNLEALRELHEDGVSMRGCNAQGESMIHLACRLSKLDVVQFLIQDAHVSVQVCDDSGRTPLHDAAWTTKPNFDLIRLLLQMSPQLLFIQDKRHYSPLRYVPKSAWPEWRHFLQQEQEWIRHIVTQSSAQKASHCMDKAQERMKNLLQRMSV